MKETSNQFGHSFLFWLLIPLLIVWFAFNYVKAVLFFRGESTPQAAYFQNGSVLIPAAVKYPALPESTNGYVTFWFDDAWLSQYLKGYPVLKDYGYKGTLAVPTHAIETPNYLNWAQVKVLKDNGWEITNHSRIHDCTMQNWTPEKIRYELRGSTIELSNKGYTSEIFVSPCGVNSPVMYNEVVRQFEGYRTVDQGINDPTNLDRYNLKVHDIGKETTIDDIKGWINEAKTGNKWLIIVFHQVDSSSSDKEKFGTDLQLFKQLLEEVKNSGAKVITPSQMLQKI